METKTIKIDWAFPWNTLDLYLNDWFIILDKTVIQDRYILYVLNRNFDTDVGKTSDSVK